MTWYAMREQRKAAQVALLQNEARVLLNQAVDRADDLARWQSALEAVRRIEVASDGDSSSRDLRREVETGLAAAERDLVLVAALADIRDAKADGHVNSTDAAYAETFRSGGIDAEALNPSDVGALVRRRPAATARALSAALDDWVAVRRGMSKSRVAGLPRLLAAARAADPDPDRDAVRAALSLADPKARLDRLRPLIERANSETWAPASLELLARGMADAGGIDEALIVLRNASGSHPDDVGIQITLGEIFEQMSPARTAQAIQAYAVARALRPESAHSLAHALDRLGRTDEATAVFRDLTRRRPDNLRHLACYSLFLANRHQPEAPAVLERTVAASREATRRRPHDAVAQFALGSSLAGQEKYGEAAAAFRAAVRLDPDDVGLRQNLGKCLANQGEHAIAITEYRKALQINPSSAAARAELASSLIVLKRLDEAIAELHAALRDDPDCAAAHAHLGAALYSQGKKDAAITEYQAALRLDPVSDKLYLNLGIALSDLGRRDEAVAAFRERFGAGPMTPRPTTRWASVCPTRGIARRRWLSTARRCGSTPPSLPCITASASP